MKNCLNILQFFSILVSVCFFAICVISFFENRRLVVNKYVVKSKKIKQTFHNFHIVHLSDMHNACYGKNNSRLICMIRDLKPDAILITGDMIVGKPGCDVYHAANTMNQLVDIAPVFFGMGNHELRAMLYKEVYGNMWSDFSSRLDKKITVLQDCSAVLNREQDSIVIHGVNLNPELYRRFRHVSMPENYLNELFGECNFDDFHIFLAHNPDYFEDYVKWGADLTLSGHVHGGMIRLPFLGGMFSPMIRFFPKYDKGLFEVNNKHMILSGGLGNHTYRFRVNNLPEVISIHLESLQIEEDRDGTKDDGL